MTWGVLVTGISYVLMPLLTQLWQFYLVFGAGRAVAGPARIGVAPNTALANGFRRRRGRAIGLLAMCIPLGNGLLVLLGQVLIDTSGWRTVFVVLAVGTLALAVPMAAISAAEARGPRACSGRRNSGREEDPAEAPDGGHRRAGWTLSQAIRSPALWLITAAGCLATTANSGITFHQVAYFTDLGLPPLDAVFSLAAFSLTGAVAAVVWGYLTERAQGRSADRDVSAGRRGSAVPADRADAGGRTRVRGAILLTSRGGSTLLNIIVAQYFGRAPYGSISGFVQPFSMVGLAVGSLVASITFDLTGTYYGVFLAYAGLWAVGAACLWLARKPGEPSAPRVASPEQPTRDCLGLVGEQEPDQVAHVFRLPGRPATLRRRDRQALRWILLGHAGHGEPR